MKKKILYIISAILILIVLSVAIFMFVTRNQQNNGNTENANTETNTEAESGIDLNDTVNGIPSALFDKVDVKFPLTLTNVKTKESFDITTTSKFTDFFEYIPLSSTDQNVFVPEEQPIKPDKTGLYVYTVLKDSEAEDVTYEDIGVFTFGAVNETNEDAWFKDARTIYISYYGIHDWKLCGVHPGMSSDAVIDAIGQPTQDLQAESGTVYEYYMLKDNHTYVLTLAFDKEERVEKVALNIDNHPVYLGN
jgi:hypothetical protein